MKTIQTIVTVVMFSLLMGCGPQAAPPPQNSNNTVIELAGELPFDVQPTLVNELRGNEEVILLDVREQWEYDDRHIPNTTLIPLGELSSRLAELPEDKTIITICRSGNRSTQAALLLQQQGFVNVHNMEGGMIAWEQANYEVE